MPRKKDKDDRKIIVGIFFGVAALALLPRILRSVQAEPGPEEPVPEEPVPGDEEVTQNIVPIIFGINS